MNHNAAGYVVHKKSIFCRLEIMNVKRRIMLTFWQRPFRKKFRLSEAWAFWHYNANKVVVQHCDWLNVQKAGATGS